MEDETQHFCPKEFCTRAREARESARSRVRRALSYAAGAYAFGGAALLVGVALAVPEAKQQVQFAKDVYLSVLPTAGGVIGFWFATRAEERDSRDG